MLIDAISVMLISCGIILINMVVDVTLNYFNFCLPFKVSDGQLYLNPEQQKTDIIHAVEIQRIFLDRGEAKSHL